MQQIFDSVIKKKILFLIYLLGNGLNEIVVDITLSFDTINTIEVINNHILIHSFNESLEFTLDFDDLDMEDKIEIYQRLFCYL